MSDTTDILAGDAGRDVEPAAAPASGPTAGPISADAGEPTEARPRRRATGLSGMLLPELQTLASSLGISGTGRMRKGELVAAIQARQGGNTTTDYTTGSSTLPAAPGLVAHGRAGCPGHPPEPHLARHRGRSRSRPRSRGSRRGQRGQRGQRGRRGRS